MKKRIVTAFALTITLLFSSIQPANADDDLVFNSSNITSSDFVDASSVTQGTYAGVPSATSQDQSTNGQVIVRGTNWGALWVSRDGGRNWSNPNMVATAIGGTSDSVVDWKQITVSPDGTKIIAAGTYSANNRGWIWISNDSGVTFNPVVSLGRKNWTGASIGLDTNKLLVLDGVATIWGKAANGTGCVPSVTVCQGSGTDLSNVKDSAGNIASTANPRALAYYSEDFGATWTSEILVPSGNTGVQYTLNSGTSTFYLKTTASGIINYYALGLPMTAPTAPTALTAIAGDSSATISFTAGSDGGSAVSNYKYSLDGTIYTALSPTDSSSPVTIPGLTNGTSYNIYLKAVNSVGDGTASSSVSVTPVAPAVSDSGESNSDYFEPIKSVTIEKNVLKLDKRQKVVIQSYNSVTKKTSTFEKFEGQYSFPKAAPGQSITYSVMATDGTVLKKVTMKSKPLVPKIRTAFTKKMNTTNQKVTITANWKKDPAVKKYLIKITLANGKSIVATATDPNFSIITDETNGAMLTITAVAKNNLTSKVSRKI